jgi:hypothetical protein
MRLIRGLMVIALAVTGAVVVTADSASAVGDYGPNTCLEGYVWREAFPGDLVCVTPDRRQQSADENAQAASLVDPNGAYGPDTCIAGYVWRDAGAANPFLSANVPDHVCVTPGIRAQVAYENTTQVAVSRMLFMSFGWVGNPDPFVFNGDGYNAGWVWVGIYRSADNSLVWGTWVIATLGGYSAFPNVNGFVVQTPVRNCTYHAANNAYLITYDYTAGVWAHATVPLAVC